MPKENQEKVIPGSGNVFADMGLPDADELDAKARIIAANGMIGTKEAEEFFAGRSRKADDKAFLRILNRKGGEPPRPEDAID